MSPLRLCLVLLVAAASACRARPASLVPAPAASALLRLDFRPPAGLALTEKVRSTLRRGTAPRGEAELTTVSRFTPERGGWLLTQQVTQARLTRDGAPVDTPVDEVLTRFPLRVRLAADGTLIEVLEPGAALAALREVLPPGVEVAALERFFSPEALEARTRREWEVKYGGLFQRALAPGQRSYAVGILLLEDREVTYLLERTFTGTRPTEQGTAAVFTLRCLGAPGEDAPEAAREALEAAGGPPLTPSVVCEGEQLLAPGRFLPLRRGLTFHVTVEGEVWTWEGRSALESLQEETR